MYYLFALILGFFIISPVYSLTIGVPGSKPTIQAGIDSASPGDTVLVQPGTYYENIDFRGKNIILGSMFLATKDSAYILNTIINALQMNTVVAFKNGETEKAELAGFTLTNGHSQAGIGKSGNNGGGIYCLNSSPYLHHLIVEGNVSELQGGGMYLENSNSVIEYCVIKNNRAILQGGGICFNSSDRPSIKYSIINDNLGIGGGILCTGMNKGYITISHVLFFNNFVSVYVGSSKVDIINCTIINKFNGESIHSESSVLNIVNTIIATDYKWSIASDVDPQYKGSVIAISHSNINSGKESILKGAQDSLYFLEGNIFKAPLFADINKNDFFLQQDSPCIDAGTSFFTFNNRIIIDIKNGEYNGSNPDIGSFESVFSKPNYVSQRNFDKITLFQNFPNPFNESTLINFFLDRPKLLNLKIYNLDGQLIETLFEGSCSAGIHNIRWNANKVSTGLYFLKLNDGTLIQTMKMVLIK